MSIEDIAMLVSAMEEFEPVVEQSVPSIMKMGKSIKPIFNALVDYQVETTNRAIMKYMGLGYSKEEAIRLTMWNKQNVVDSIKMNNNK